MNLKKAGLVYAASAGVAAGVAYLRGRRGTDLLRDTAVHGFVAGTGLVATGYALDLVKVEVPLLSNPSEHLSMGNMPKKAVALLSQVNPASLFAPMKRAGVKVAPVPEDPAVIMQDED